MPLSDIEQALGRLEQNKNDHTFSTVRQLFEDAMILVAAYRDLEAENERLKHEGKHKLFHAERRRADDAILRADVERRRAEQAEARYAEAVGAAQKFFDAVDNRKGNYGAVWPWQAEKEFRAFLAKESE